MDSCDDDTRQAKEINMISVSRREAARFQESSRLPVYSRTKSQGLTRVFTLVKQVKHVSWWAPASRPMSITVHMKNLRSYIWSRASRSIGMSVVVGNSLFGEENDQSSILKPLAANI